ncbi:MAG TPA: MarR family winged helix-turn-helix transcriptional regulator [Ktedonobacteraceae bacterium]|nr:MarR family winged helix-turn-helix transcriptional regulator [Ktedonobacteraceae bacterium]
MEHLQQLALDETAQKLMRAFMQFHRVDWHDRSVAGCRPSEIRVLFCVKRGAKPDSLVTVSEIGKRLGVTSPTVTQLLKGLEANGLVERHIDPHDRRAVVITLTPKGDMVTHKAIGAFADSMKGLIEYLGEEESNHLAELLLKTARYYQEKAATMNDAYWNGEES